LGDIYLNCFNIKRIRKREIPMRLKRGLERNMREREEEGTCIRGIKGINKDLWR
jgi:hypothetical protein